MTGISNSATTMTATLSDGAAQSYLLSVTIRGSGEGTVTSSPAGIDCSNGTCSANLSGPVTLTAVPGVRGTLKAWGGTCSGVLSTCVVTMTGATTVVATFAAVFTDAAIGAGLLIKAVHIQELRSAIDTLRRRYNVAPSVWTDASLAPGGPVRAVHLAELRAAVIALYQAAGMAAPAFSDPVLMPGVTPVRAAHMEEIRAAVRGLE